MEIINTSMSTSDEDQLVGNTTTTTILRINIVFPQHCSPLPVHLTVWCKSLLFNGHGYTVFDDNSGQMVFRVDNYAHKWKQETVLMDCVGNALLTIKRHRKILKLTKSWVAYKGDQGCIKKILGQQNDPLFRATKDLGNESCKIAMVSDDESSCGQPLGYKMKWSRNDECLKIYQATANKLVAEVGRKYVVSPIKLLDKDVLSLKVQPGMDQALAMAMIMITNSMRL